MHKSVFISVFALALCTGVQAQAWAQKWQWPLLPVQQAYNVGDDRPSEPGIGGTGHYWQYPDPLEAAELPTTGTKPQLQPAVTTSEPSAKSATPTKP